MTHALRYYPEVVAADVESASLQPRSPEGAQRSPIADIGNRLEGFPNEMEMYYYWEDLHDEDEYDERHG